MKEENKKLREQLIQRNMQNDNLGRKNKELEEENKNLKNELMEDMKTETKLNERIRFLEQCLDNKEKVNKSLREELERYKKQYEHTMGED